MMFSTKAEYGVRVMVELARRAGESPDGAESVVPLAEIAEHDGMPLAYLEHLVARLRKAGIAVEGHGLASDIGWFEHPAMASTIVITAMVLMITSLMDYL